MGKKCAKCGKELPAGAKTCPACGAEAEARGAALFTQMTAETEGWRNRRRERTTAQKRRTGLIALAVLALAAALFLILFLQPEARVLRAIRAGRYAEAAELYWADSALAERGSARIDQAVLEAAQSVSARFAARELDAETAAGDISSLSTIGSGGELLSEVIDSFRGLADSSDHMTQARQLFYSGNYLEAREEFLLVREDDGFYEEAQQEARRCLSEYGEQAIQEADRLIQVGDVAEAVRVLAAREAKLLEYDYYYEKLDQKHRACLELLTEGLLKQASELAANGDPQAAADLLLAHMEEFGLTDETLAEAQAGYFAAARSGDVAEAAASARELFAAGNYEAAFEALDALTERPDIPAEELDAAVEKLEAQYAQEKINEAKELYGGDRDKLPEAIAVLREAMRLREVDAIADYWEDLSHYLPYSLADEDYIEKSGVIFRSSSAFEALNGETYDQGWIWGENESSLSFRLGGNYDLLSAVFTVRREDDHQAAARFEVWCDDELVYTSDRLEHWQSEPILVEVDVSGCDKLTLRFLNDYAVSTTEDGYCYHGLCSPVVTKTIRN